MDDKENILRDIGQLEYQSVQIDGLLRDFMNRGDCNITCTENEHICSLRIFHNFVTTIRQKIINNIETLQAEVEQIEAQATI